MADFDFNLSGNEKIIQNVNNTVSRIRGTLPLNRGKGISNDYVDEAQGISEAKMTVEIIEEIEREEPRYQVEGVTFEYDENGKTVPSIEGVIVDE